VARSPAITGSTSGISTGAHLLSSVDPRLIESFAPVHAIHRCKHVAHEPANL
jgi:hypothetical protein